MSRSGRAVLAVAAVVVGVAAVGGAVILLGGTPTPTVALPAPRFVDATAASGLDHTYGGAYTASIGGGLAVLDCDDDARPDLFVAGGDHPAALFRNESAASGGPRFARLDDPVTARDGVTGAYPLDIDADGHPDLAVLRTDGIEILRGLGGCRFEDATGALGLDGVGGWVTAFSATWEADGLPTLAIGRYLQLDEAGEPIYECDGNDLVRPDGPSYAAPLPLDPGYCALSMLFSDWDGSGRRDLRVSNDRQYYDFVNGQEQLWRVTPGETPRLYTADDGWVQMQLWGMGIASHDLTGDGLPELYLTSQGDNKLQTLASGPDQPMYRDIALRRGVIGTRPVNGGDPLPSTAWHPAFEDVNNDGFIDLYVSKGNVAEQAGYATRDPSNLFIGQPDGTFLEQADAAGILNYDRGRGSALVDLDLDGLLDLVEVKLDAAGAGLAQRRVDVGDGRGAGADGQLARHPPASAGVEPGRDRRRRRGRHRRRPRASGDHRRRGPYQRPADPAACRARRGRRGTRARDVARRGAGEWLTIGANQTVLVERGATEATPVVGGER